MELEPGFTDPEFAGVQLATAPHGSAQMADHRLDTIVATGCVSDTGSDRVFLGHAGFEGFWLRDKKQLESRSFHYQLHHKYFECNYGTVEVPWDVVFGSFHNGTPEATQRIRARKKRLKQG